MKIDGVVYYQPTTTLGLGSVRLDYILWCKDGSGSFVSPISSTYTISGAVLKNQKNLPIIKMLSSLSAGSDGFFSGSIGVAWNQDYVAPEKLLVLSFTGDENTIRLIPKKLPYPMGAWAQVYLEACKLGVLTMTDQAQPLDVVINQIVDSIRNGMQVVPGQSDSFFVQTAPASGTSWGVPVAFGFECVGFKVYNFGTIPVFFSLDGTNTHGFIPPGTTSWYDFRRTSQIYFQAQTSDPQLFVEAW